MAEFLYEARFRIPNLRGLKFSHDDLVDLRVAWRSRKGPTTCSSASTKGCWPAFAWACEGRSGRTYNFAGRHYLKLIRAFESGDIAAARAAQLEATEMVKTLASFGFMAASKAVMSLIGVDCGPVRPPLRNLTPAQIDALVEQASDTRISRGRFNCSRERSLSFTSRPAAGPRDSRRQRV